MGSQSQTRLSDFHFMNTTEFQVFHYMTAKTGTCLWFSRVRLFAMPWTAAHLSSLSFSILFFFWHPEAYLLRKPAPGWESLAPNLSDRLPPAGGHGEPHGKWFPESPGWLVGILWEGGPPAAAAAKLLQSCPTLCDPIDGSPPGFPSLGFSRQEHWSGLPFPSPMHESGK